VIDAINCNVSLLCEILHSIIVELWILYLMLITGFVSAEELHWTWTCIYTIHPKKLEQPLWNSNVYLGRASIDIFLYYHCELIFNKYYTWKSLSRLYNFHSSTWII